MSHENAPILRPRVSITDSQIVQMKLKDESTTSSDSGEESCEVIELPSTGGSLDC